MNRKKPYFTTLGRRFGFGVLLFIMTTAFAPGVEAQIVINNLTGGTSSHQSTINNNWSKHEWDIIFPVQFRGQQLANPVLYYRVGNPINSAVISGGFTSGNDGAFISSVVNGQFSASIEPPGTGETDPYFVFDFTGQTLNIPADGVVWFRFTVTSGINFRMDIGALGTFTTTYEQNDNVRSGGTSFAIFGDPVSVTPVPMLSPWALIVLSLLLGLVVLRRSRVSA